MRPGSARHLDTSSEGESPSPRVDGRFALMQGDPRSSSSGRWSGPRLPPGAPVFTLLCRVGRKSLIHALSGFSVAEDPLGRSAIGRVSSPPPSVRPGERSSRGSADTPPQRPESTSCLSCCPGSHQAASRLVQLPLQRPLLSPALLRWGSLLACAEPPRGTDQIRLVP